MSDFEPRATVSCWIRALRDEGRTEEAEAVHGRADHRGFEEHGAGATTVDLAREHGVLDAMSYNSTGMDVW